jgi:hypothetical protein
MAVVVIWLAASLVIVAVGVVTWRLGWERYRPRDPGPTVPTDEVLVDPETGRRQRVHMNPTTGARVYLDEPPPPQRGGHGHAP